jgi:hypothetical protein
MEGQWRKSSYSNGGEANCVEVLGTWVRDSKAPGEGVLKFADEAWGSWMAAVKAGELDR